MVSRQVMDIETGSSRGASNLSKFSLLGQQFTQFESTLAQGSAYCQPSLGNSRHNNMNIDLGRSFEDVHQSQPQLQTQGYGLGYDGHDLNMNIGQRSDLSGSNGLSPQVLLSTLSLLQQKITQLQSLVHLIVQDEAKPGQSSSENFSRQQVVALSVQSIISQLVAAAAVMLPSSQQPIFNMLGMNGLSDQLQLGHLVGDGQGLGRDSFNRGGMSGSNNNSVRVNSFNSADSGSGSTENIALQSQSFMKASTATNDGKVSGVANNGTSQFGDTLVSEAGVGEDNDLSGNSKDDEEDGEGESLPPGSYQLVQMEAKEILAEHTHFCEICNKGFKRDANLRMHMRGHGDEYKTPAALARPDKPQDLGPSPQRRYSCPFVGCKRNKEHKKFQPLKTMLCVKNHYRRSHCPKMYTCNRCKIKKFSVVADLKTHEKHCGRDKWQCSCGTTFSRKDKLFGHIALFQGHTPAFTSTDTDGSTPEQIGNNNGGSSSGNGIAVSTFANSCGNSSIVGPPYNTANVTPPIGNVLETGTGVSLGQLAMKNISFSQEGNAQNMELGSSNSLPAFSGSLMQGTFMLQSLLSNNFLQNGGN